MKYKNKENTTRMRSKGGMKQTFYFFSFRLLASLGANPKGKQQNETRVFVVFLFICWVVLEQTNNKNNNDKNRTTKTKQQTKKQQKINNNNNNNTNNNQTPT